MNFGLSEKEARVYLAALELGGTSVQNIAKKSNVNRATVYTNIEELKDRGLMYEKKEGRRILFCAESPEKLITQLLEEEERLFELQEKKKQDLVARLYRKEIKSRSMPVVRYFEGREGVRELVKDVFAHGDEEMIRIFYPDDLLRRIFSDDELELWTKMRKDRGLDFKAIYTSSNIPSKKRTSKRIHLSKDQLHLECDVMIFDDQVRIITLEDPIVAIVIEDTNIAQSMRSIYDYLWEAIQDGILK
jgi:sugar-specific transcriptional regulator TrmB